MIWRVFKITKNLREEKLVVKVGVVAATQRLTRCHICFQCSLRHCIVIIRGKQHSTTSIHFCIKRTREREIERERVGKKERKRERELGKESETRKDEFASSSKIDG